MNMIVVSYEQQSLLQNILDAGNKLTFDHDSNSFNVPGFEWYDMTNIYTHLLEDAQNQWSVKSEVIAVINARKLQIKK